MRKQVFTLAFVALVVCFSQAQVGFRPYVGVNSHTLTENFEDADWKSALGYQLGLDVQIGSKFYVQPGLQLEFAKNKIEPTGTGTGIEINVKRTHLRLPVMVGYAFGNLDGNFSFRIFTGPNASIVLNSDAEDFDLDKDDLKSAVFGWNAGAGVDISILFIDLGYQIGLSEVFENFDNGSKDNFYYANAGIRLRF